ncbi:MAG: hypothetical protein IH853_12810 [Bacteroidetes bacterium]|nr:hypothetical protein [Bacteroidota bacterium]
MGAFDKLKSTFGFTRGCECSLFTYAWQLVVVWKVLTNRNPLPGETVSGVELLRCVRESDDLDEEKKEPEAHKFSWNSRMLFPLGSVVAGIWAWVCPSA